MELTYNQFRKVASKSSDKLFDKFSGIFAESENAALMALFDDKFILLDEDKNQPYICDYQYSDGILSFGKFESIALIENDDTVLENKVNQLFDIVNDPRVTLDELVEGFRLKYYDNARKEITEALDNKLMKIHESTDIKVKRNLRGLRDKNYAMVMELLNKSFMKKVAARLRLEENPIAQSLNKVDFTNKKGYKVDTNIYTYLEPDITDLEDKTIKKKMQALAGKLYKLWKTDAFRQKFTNFTMDLKQAEDLETSLEAAESFFEDNKELFLLEPSRFEEVMLKTALMVESKDANVLVDIMKNLMQHPDIAAIKESYFNSLGATPEQIAQIMFEQEAELPAAPAPELEPEEPKKKAKVADDVETEELKEIIATFKAIKKQVEADSEEADYLEGIITDLENAKAKGVTDDRMKDIIDFLQGATEEPEKEKEKDKEEEPEKTAELEEK